MYRCASGGPASEGSVADKMEEKQEEEAVAWIAIWSEQMGAAGETP